MLTRRDFLRHVPFAVAGMMALPALLENELLKAAQKSMMIGAGDKLRVGVIGCGNMGWYNLIDALLIPEVDCVALCDIDSNLLARRTGDLAKIRDLKPDLYGDYRKLLERKDIDFVIIGTPDHWHCLNLTDACAAGKDVYVEKPLANSIAECDAMVAAAKKYGRVVTVGQQQRSGNHWIEMKKYLDSGQLGKVARVDIWANFNYAALGPKAPDKPVPAGVDYDMWLGPAPYRPYNSAHIPGGWRMFWDFGGGLMTDWGVHLLDMALWGLNVTDTSCRTAAMGGKYAFPDNSPETFDTQSVIYDFGDAQITWNQCAGTETGFWGRNYGLAFRGTNGILVADRNNWEVIPEPRGNSSAVEPVKVSADGLDHQTHVKNFVECVKTRDTGTACTIENGALCAKYAHLGNIAARTGNMLRYDDTRKSFGIPEADKLVKPAYRTPWKFPPV